MIVVKLTDKFVTPKNEEIFKFNNIRYCLKRLKYYFDSKKFKIEKLKKI